MKIINFMIGMGHILAIKKLDNNRYIKKVFSYKGHKINYVEDKIKSDKLVNRKIGDKFMLEIEENETVNTEKDIEFRGINSFEINKKDKNKSHIRNPNISVIDIETYADTNTGNGKVYSTGLYSNCNKKPIIFYIDENTMDNYKVVSDLLD